MRKLMIIAAMIAAFGLGGAAAVASSDRPASVPGSPGDNCSHGNSDKPCKPDPQPDNGKDCEDHGRARGNEDHCLDTTETTHTDTTDTTHTDTTHTDTTETTHTDTTHTGTTDTTHTDTTDTHTDTTGAHTDTTDTTHTGTTTEITGTTHADTTSTESAKSQTTPVDTTGATSGKGVFKPPASSKKPAKNKQKVVALGVAQGPSDAAQAPPLTP